MDERISGFLRKPWVIPAGVGLISFGVGCVVGYRFGQEHTVRWVSGQERKERKLREEIEREVARRKAENALREEQEAEDEAPEEVELTPEELAHFHEETARSKARVQAREAGEPIPVFDEEPAIIEFHGDSEEPEPVNQNIFIDPITDWDYEEELATREANPEKPYVLHRDEFFSHESGYQQSTLTYYAADDVLADEDDTPIYNYENLIGPLQFGRGSGDPLVFHVRNDKREAEFEVLRHETSYAEEVLGVLSEEELDRIEKKDLKHAHIRKFKPSD